MARYTFQAEGANGEYVIFFHKGVNYYVKIYN